MSRFLFVVPPLAGHVNPTIAVAGELTARGHQVAWAGHASVVGPLLPRGAGLFATDRTPDGCDLRAIHERGQGLRGADAFRFLWKDFLIPLGETMLPEVDDAVERFAPDLMIVDQQAIAGAVIATTAAMPARRVCRNALPIFMSLLLRWITELNR